jgi:hypothetical protein
MELKETATVFAGKKQKTDVQSRSSRNLHRIPQEFYTFLMLGQ